MEDRRRQQGRRRSPTTCWPTPRSSQRPSRIAKQTAITPLIMANGAKSLLDEVAKSKVTGEEERYSHFDLVDFAANVDGSKEAYTRAAPRTAKQRARTLVKTLDTRFSTLGALLATHAASCCGQPEDRQPVRPLHGAEQGRRQGPGHRGRRPQRAARSARGRAAGVMTDDRRPGLASPAAASSGLIGAGVAAGAGAVAGADAAFGGSSSKAAAPPLRRAVPRPAPGRHRHPCPGPAALRLLRPLARRRPVTR